MNLKRNCISDDYGNSKNNFLSSENFKGWITDDAVVVVDEKEN